MNLPTFSHRYKMMTESDPLLEKTDPLVKAQGASLEKAIAHAEAALLACDELGLMMAAIDISSALDKLKSCKTPDCAD